MNWNTKKEMVARSTRSNSGSWCIFVALSDTEGVKFYASEAERTQAAELQSFAASKGLGPQVGEFCTMALQSLWDHPMRWAGEDIPEIVYGYMTEIVDTDPLDKYTYDLLIARLNQHNISTRDLTSRQNVGITPDGSPVRFDFDPTFYYDE